MKKVIKRLANLIFGDRLFARVMSIRSRNYQRRILEEKGLISISRRMVDKFGTRVLHGPFHGMVYPADSLVSRHGAPKLLGSYEQELHPVINEVIENAAEYELMVDIGCAEGYYAVGLALKTGKIVDAFDTEPREIAYCREMARQNKVENKVILHDWCGSRYLQGLEDKRCFIISDCEGYEGTLFDAITVKSLKRCDLLIELHDLDGIIMSEVISDRFRNTHEIRLIPSVSPRVEQYDELEFLGDKAQAAIWEYRSDGQMWAHLSSRFRESPL